MTFKQEVFKAIEEYNNKITSLSYTPLKVTFDMSTPVMLNYPFINFDSLIEHFTAKDALGDLFYDLPSRNPIDFNVNLPAIIKRLDFDKDGKKDYISLSSVSFFDNPEAISSEIVYKKFDSKHLENLKNRKSSVRINSGEFRSYRMKFAVNYSKKVRFYCIADIEHLEDIIERVRYLGKKRSYGHGKVRGYKIEECDFTGLLKDNQTARPIPLEIAIERKWNIEDKELAIMTYKTPYWAKQNNTLCVAPFVEIN